MQSFQSQGAQMTMAMQQVGQSLQNLAQGQAQMLNMMQPSGVMQPGGMGPIPKRAAAPAPSLPESFHLDGPEAVAWSDVELEGSSPESRFNPNEMHPDFGNTHGQPGC